MKQMILPQNGGSLLAYAESKLSADVFSHPVWVRFGNKYLSHTPDLMNGLSSEAQSLQKADPSSACQILLICAFYQNYAGQHFNAIQSTQQALSIAEQAHLAQESVWAIWGACAIAFQQGKYEEAARYLVELQGVLGVQNEWMLANFIDVLRQSFLNPATMGTLSGIASNHGPEETLMITLDWFKHWGFPPRTFEPQVEKTTENPANPVTTHTTLIQSFFSFQRWQGSLRTLMLVIQGELKLQWTKSDPSFMTRRDSFWNSSPNPFEAQHTHNIDIEAPNGAPQIAGVPLLPPAQESSTSKIPDGKSKSTQETEKTTGKSHEKISASVIPAAVHMLGSFSMTIGDLTVKLPSSRGLSLLKYLLLHHKQSIPREVLMDTFWPEAEPELARNNLNVAMHNLRKAFFAVTDLPMIIFENGLYSLPSDLQIWLDIEEFEGCVKAGKQLESRNQLTAAVTEYEKAISLYQGDFLEQDPYEEWAIIDRERLRVNYLDTLDRLSQIYFDQERYAACITVCQLILTRDRCREDAHYLLMRCYSRQGQSHLALRQFQACVEALRDELEAEPEPTTVRLAERIRRHERV